MARRRVSKEEKLQAARAAQAAAARAAQQHNVDPRMMAAQRAEHNRRSVIAELSKRLFALLMPGESMILEFFEESKILQPGQPPQRKVGALNISRPTMVSGVGVKVDLKEDFGVDPDANDEEAAEDSTPDEPEDYPEGSAHTSESRMARIRASAKEAEGDETPEDEAEEKPASNIIHLP